MTSVSPVYPDNSLQMKIKSGIYDIDFSKMSISSPGPSIPRRNSSALGAISQVKRISVPDFEARFSRTPEPRLHRRNSITSSMKKFRNKVTHVIDRLNVSFSEYIGEHREHTTPTSPLAKSSRGKKKSIEKILSSGGIRRNKIAPATSLFHSFKPKILFKKRGSPNDRDVNAISRSSSCSSLPSLASVEYHQPIEPMETGSGRVLIYDDLEKSIVSFSFSDHSYDDIHFIEDHFAEVDVHRPEDPHFEANQSFRRESYMSRVPTVPEEMNRKFMINQTLQSLHCSTDKSDESFESRSSCSKIVHPSWSNEQLDNKEDDYVVIKRKSPCDEQEKKETGGFVLSNKNHLDLDETDGFVMVNQEEDVKKANRSYVLSMYV